MPAFDAPPPLVVPKSTPSLPRNQTRLGVVSVARRAREIVQHCLGPRAAWGRRRAQREYSATLVHLARGIRPASAEARGAIEHAATTHHHGTETIVPTPESVDHGLSPRAARRRRRGQRKHCAANTAIDSSGIGRAVEHAAAADCQRSAGGGAVAAARKAVDCCIKSMRRPGLRAGQRKHRAAGFARALLASAVRGGAVEHSAAVDYEISARTIVNVVRVCESRTTLPRSRATWGRRRGQREHHAAGRVPTRGAIEYPEVADRRS